MPYKGIKTVVFKIAGNPHTPLSISISLTFNQALDILLVEIHLKT